MTPALRRTKAKALTLTRSVANALKLSIDISRHKQEKTVDPPQSSVTQAPKISRPRRLKRTPMPRFTDVHMVNQLPPELLAHIFMLGSESEPMLPVTLSHVCCTWRRVALRTSGLWRQITLDSRLDMWRERIHRSRACPLEIQLVPWFADRPRRGRSYWQDMAAVQLYMHIVAPYIRRWRSLEIVFYDYSPYLWNAALSECCSIDRNVQAPLLEELTLRYRNNDDTKEFCLFSNYAPRLRYLTIDGIKLAWTCSLFGKLTYLDYTHHAFTRGYAAAQEVLSMLRVCPYLTKLKILFPYKRLVHYHSLPGPLESSPIVLPRLTDLHLRVEGHDIPSELVHLATLLRTPSLKRLHLMDMDRRNCTLPGVRVFFSMYILPNSLRVLSIECGWYDDYVLASILRAPSSLQRLVLRRTNMRQQVLELTT